MTRRIRFTALKRFRSPLLFGIALAILLVLPLNAKPLFPQSADSTDKAPVKADTTSTAIDTLDRPALLLDSSLEDSTQADRIRARQRRSGLDTIVNLFSVDSAVYMIRQRRIELHGNARLDYGQMQLQADLIELLLDSTLLRASAGRDESGRLVGIPRFKRWRRRILRRKNHLQLPDPQRCGFAR